jgi:hypothetical protein
VATKLNFLLKKNHFFFFFFLRKRDKIWGGYQGWLGHPQWWFGGGFSHPLGSMGVAKQPIGAKGPPQILSFFF